MKDPVKATVDALVVRWGDKAVSLWFAQMGQMHQMFLESMTHLSGGKDAAVAAEAIGLVMRFPSEDPEGTCAVVALGPCGQMDAAERGAMLERALSQMRAGDDLLPPGPMAVRARLDAERRQAFHGPSMPSSGAFPSGGGSNGA